MTDLVANALRSIATIIGCPANTDPLTDLDGLVSMVRVVTADRDVMRHELGRLQSMLALDAPYAVHDVLARLADAADHLHHDHNCDADGWEMTRAAAASARRIVAALVGYTPPDRDADERLVPPAGRQGARCRRPLHAARPTAPRCSVSAPRRVRRRTLSYLRPMSEAEVLTVQECARRMSLRAAPCRAWLARLGLLARIHLEGELVAERVVWGRVVAVLSGTPQAAAAAPGRRVLLSAKTHGP